MQLIAVVSILRQARISPCAVPAQCLARHNHSTYVDRQCSHCNIASGDVSQLCLEPVVLPARNTRRRHRATHVRQWLERVQCVATDPRTDRSATSRVQSLSCWSSTAFHKATTRQRGWTGDWWVPSATEGELAHSGNNSQYCGPNYLQRRVVYPRAHAVSPPRFHSFNDTLDRRQNF